MNFSEEIAALERAITEGNSTDRAHAVQGPIARALGVEGKTIAVKAALNLPLGRETTYTDILNALKKLNNDDAPAGQTLTARISILETQNKNLEERLKHLEKIIADNKNLEERLQKLERLVGV